MTNPSPERTSRRDFMKTSTTAAVSAGLLAGYALPRAYAAGSDVIRIGLVGCGGRGSGAAHQALSTKGNVQLVAMADAFEDQLHSSLHHLKHEFSSQPERVAVEPDHQFVGFDAYEKLLASPIVDLVILATPPGFRPIQFEAAVKAGKNIFTEKPLAVDGPGVRRVLAANEHAKSKNLKVGVGLQRHHQAPYIETIDRIKSGAIGDVVAMRVYWNDFGVWEPRKTRHQVKSEMEYQMRNWYYYVWLCGDHIVEQHIHNLDVANWIKGDHPAKCWGMGGRQVLTDKRYGEIFDHHCVQYEYADGSRAFSECRHQPNTWRSVTEHAVGTKGTANVSSYHIKSGSEDWKYRGHSANPYQVEHDDLFAAIRANRSYNEVENGAASTLTAIMGRMATYSGKEVGWDAALNSQVDLSPEQYAWNANPRSMPLADGSYAIPVPGVTKAV